jgi:hypothetical protein
MDSRRHKEYRTTVLDEIKKYIFDSAMTLYKGADSIADIIVDDRRGDKGTKTYGVKKQLISMVNDIKSGTAKKLDCITPGRMVCDLFRGAGRLSGRAKADCVDLFNNLIGRQNG